MTWLGGWQCWLTGCGLALMQKATSDYDEIKSDPVKLTELKKKTTERWLACLFIKNSDQTRHGTMIKKLREQKAPKHDSMSESLCQQMVRTVFPIDTINTLQHIRATDIDERLQYPCFERL